jgi:hypothetical protein
MMAGLEDIVGKTGNYNVRDKFKRFDNRFIRPYLIRDLQVNTQLRLHCRISDDKITFRSLTTVI